MAKSNIPEQLKDIENIEQYDIDWNYKHNVSICERSKTVIEPMISEEFFLSYKNKDTGGKSLQEHGLEGVAETNFYPEAFRDQANNFLNNINDWCISRDLTWGHRFPVWYNLDTNPDKQFLDAANADEAKMKVQSEQPTEAGNWVQEEKILDTWFSSSLWPLSTLDYVENQEGFKLYYPTQLMTTGKEIFYLWIVRMTTLGKYFSGEVPFEDVVITPTILDEKGKKMSKSLGNGLVPEDAIDKYSADSLRLTLLGGSIPNRNMKFGGKLADTIMEKMRNFGNKLWNIAKFFEYQDSENNFGTEQSELTPASQWILSRYFELENNLESNTKEHNLARSTDQLMKFLWDDYADWYLEYLKTDSTQLHFAKTLFEKYTVTLHPYMPFETEVLWSEFFGHDSTLAFEVKDNAELEKLNTGGKDEFETIVKFIKQVRSTKGLFGIDPATSIDIFSPSELLNKYSDFTKLLAKGSIVNQTSDNIYNIKSGELEYGIDILNIISDKEVEVKRTNKIIENLDKQITQLDKQLANEKFVANAEPEVIEQKKQDLVNRQNEKQQQLTKLEFLNG